MNPTELLLQREMSIEQKALFRFEMDKERRNPATMRLLSVFCLHRFYVGQTGLAIAQWITIAFVFGIFWWIYDLFNVSRMTEELNDSKAHEIASTIMQLMPDPALAVQNVL
jgi:TM2 domain-containing membrane protein YozV